MGMPFLFQVHGRWHSLGITQSRFVVLCFPYSSANTYTRKTVKLRALQARRFINGVHILFGRLTAQKRRLPDFMYYYSSTMSLISIPLALLSESFAIWQTLH